MCLLLPNSFFPPGGIRSGIGIPIFISGLDGCITKAVSRVAGACAIEIVEPDFFALLLLVLLFFAHLLLILVFFLLL